MAAFLSILPLLLNLLPAIISFIEQIHGPGNGAVKAAAAVDLAQKLIPEIAPHLTDDPKKAAVVSDLLTVAVSVMNATGMMPKAGKPATLVAPADPG